MPGMLVGALLIASLLLVHFSMRTRPMPVRSPLDVDDGLPWPEAGQASTVFSLTALFGAYFGIYLVLGIWALAGLAFGTVLGLFLIRSWIDAAQPSTFEQFLSWVLRGAEKSAGTLGAAIFGAQCAYAASELLILRELAKASLGVASNRATLLAIAVGIIGYFYVLFGGYMAVFRTDVLQFLLVGGMAVAVAGTSLVNGIPHGWTATLLPRQGYWSAPILGNGPGLYAYHFLIGAIIGAGFLTVCPDAWKRVFIVTQKKTNKKRFFTFVAVGILPFLLLPALALTTLRIPDGTVNPGLLFSSLVSNNAIYICATLGLVGSFLSAFDSAILAAVHTVLIVQRKNNQVEFEGPRFHWLMVGALLCTSFLFMAFIFIGNPYLLSNLLMGLFAAIAGAQIGSKGAGSLLPGSSLLWIVVLGFVGWFWYISSVVGFPSMPSTYQVNTVPVGALLVIMIAIVSYISCKRGLAN